MTPRNFVPHSEPLEPRLPLAPLAFAVRNVVPSQEILGSYNSVVDMDNDGDLDLLTGGGSDGFRSEWFEDIGDPVNGFARHFVGRMDDEQPPYAAPADLDMDGDLDVVTFDGWFENLGGGDFGSSVSEELPAEPFLQGYDRPQDPWAEQFSLTHAYAEDVDSDGDPDLLLTYRFRGAFSPSSTEFVGWLENSGSGRSWFIEADFDAIRPIEQISGFDNALSDLKLVDLDGDGVRDLLAFDVLSASDLTNRFVWFKHVDGQGTFGPRTLAGPNLDVPLHVATEILMADLDGDGDNDILYSSRRGQALVWFPNLDGKGSFGPRRDIVSPEENHYPATIAVGDIDRDGDLDIAVSMYSPGGGGLKRPLWLENQGKASGFVRHEIVEVRMLPFDIVLEDIDQDGDLDIFGLATIDRKLPALDFGVYFEQRVLGDANDDGRFDSSDLVAAMQAGEYEDDRAFNSSYEEGDWNGDDEFTSRDLILAFQAGHYEVAEVNALSDKAMLRDVMLALTETKDRRSKAFVS